MLDLGEVIGISQNQPTKKVADLISPAPFLINFKKGAFVFISPKRHWVMILSFMCPLSIWLYFHQLSYTSIK